LDSPGSAAAIHTHGQSGDDRGLKNNVVPVDNIPGWEFKNLGFLLQDLHSMVRMKSVQGSIMYLLLLFLAMLAIFDTQVLSIWRPKKRDGDVDGPRYDTDRIIELFTLEGALHSFLAALVGAFYGIPLLAYIANKGFALPAQADNFGFAIGEKTLPDLLSRTCRRYHALGLFCNDNRQFSADKENRTA